MMALNQEKIKIIEQKDGHNHDSEHHTLLTTEMSSSPRAIGSM